MKCLERCLFVGTADGQLATANGDRFFGEAFHLMDVDQKGAMDTDEVFWQLSFEVTDLLFSYKRPTGKMQLHIVCKALYVEHIAKGDRMIFPF